LTPSRPAICRVPFERRAERIEGGQRRVDDLRDRSRLRESGWREWTDHTNRSPYPTLHLLREASVERALEGVSDPDAIYENNIVRMRELGLAGWEALWVDGEGRGRRGRGLG
jgi:hypothetical protein